ncbi:MAG: phytoene/squalene synthase family protein [Gammaproteobacteria bacterium]|nr:phytoene/squalene synthase family protein [Gammaproteobacteria bacterium]
MNKPPDHADEVYQEHILQGVSRTFALTIPQLPEGLRKVISNAYLLCRIADTVEDDSALTREQTRKLSDFFSEVVTGRASAEKFSNELYPLLSAHTSPAEHDLIKNVPAVLRITHSFNTNQRQALDRCIRIMAKGMADYQDTETLEGLKDLQAMDEYCYHVAGVVGEMLTELFCDYSQEINAHKDKMMQLAVSFGQGLQMTNILKDIWEDRKRGACWLPRDIFLNEGFNLIDLQPGCRDKRFHRGLGQLIGVAINHLKDALSYTLIIPPRETGIRRFCLWALGMAVLTLNKLNNYRDFSSGTQVKISRRSVRATVLITSLFARHDRLLKLLFDLTSRNLPVTAIREKLDNASCNAV